MEIYRVAFIGHREVDDLKLVEENLIKKLIELVCSKDFVEFYMGRDGEFDEMAASCIKRVQKIYGKSNSAMTLVLPYGKADIPYYEKYYDSIFIPEEASSSHFKSAITKRNQWLVDNADLLIAFVKRKNGGAADCLKMAEKADIEIFRI